MNKRVDSIIINWTKKYTNLIQIYSIISISPDYKYYYFDDYSFNSIKKLLNHDNNSCNELEYLNRIIRNSWIKYEK